jgi:hypothetical protein
MDPNRTAQKIAAAQRQRGKAEEATDWSLSVPGGRLRRKRGEDPMGQLQYAVTDGQGGTSTVVLPVERRGALAIRDKHRGRFWCSEDAGGCGGPLILKAGSQRIPHFSHHAGQSHGCPLDRDPTLARESYRHMAIQQALCAWLRRQGYSPEPEWVMPGGRADVSVTAGNLRYSLEVQLSPIEHETLRRRDLTYRRYIDHVTWLFDPALDTCATSHLLERDVAFHVAIDKDLSKVQIGTRFIDGTIKWSGLDECGLNDSGFHTPYWADAEQATARWRLLQRLQEALTSTLAQLRAREDDLAQSPWVRPPAAARLPLHGRPVAPTQASDLGGWTLRARRALFPEARAWTPATGWHWLAQLPEELHDSTRYLAYFTAEIYSNGTIASLPFHDTPDPARLQAQALIDEGLIEPYEVHGIARWRRT